MSLSIFYIFPLKYLIKIYLIISMGDLMVTIFLRTIILYFSMIFAMRLMGKKQVGELQPGELVVSMAISDLASIPMQDMNQPILSGLIPIATLMCMEVILSFLALKSRTLRKVITGTPCILVSHGIIKEKELQKMRYNLSDLTEELRTAGYSDIRDVEYAVLETTGSLNIIPVSKKRPITPEDLNLTVEPSKLMITVISDGELLKDSLNGLGHDEKWLYSKLKSHGIKNIKDVFYAAASGNDIHIQKRGSR